MRMASFFRKAYPKNFRIIRKMLYLPESGECSIGIADDYVRLQALWLASKEVKETGVVGNVAELGVYKGDFAKYINRFFHERELYLFDTFEGFDAKDVSVDVRGGFSDGKQDFSDTCVGNVLKKMPYPGRCHIRKGWFPKTAEGLDDERYAFVSIDADLFDPIYAGLNYFYPRLSRGGVIFIHDYNNVSYAGVKEAVRKYCLENGLVSICLPDICGTAVIAK